MLAHWSSRLFLWSSGTFLTISNLDQFGIFSVSFKDGWTNPLWITKAPTRVQKNCWVYY